MFLKNHFETQAAEKVRFFVIFRARCGGVLEYVAQAESMKKGGRARFFDRMWFLFLKLFGAEAYFPIYL